MPNNSYLDMTVLNVTEPKEQSLRPLFLLLPFPPLHTFLLTTLPTIPNLFPRLNQQAGTPSFPVPGGAGSTIQAPSGGSTYIPASIGEFYKIASFGHAEVPVAGGAAGITYQIWVDSVLLFEWADFNGHTSPKIDQWKFDVPLFVEKQIVFRIVNQTGAPITTGVVEACFAGWSEQKMGFLEMDKMQIQNVTV